MDKKIASRKPVIFCIVACLFIAFGLGFAVQSRLTAAEHENFLMQYISRIQSESESMLITAKSSNQNLSDLQDDIANLRRYAGTFKSNLEQVTSEQTIKLPEDAQPGIDYLNALCDYLLRTDFSNHDEFYRFTSILLDTPVIAGQSLTDTLHLLNKQLSSPDGQQILQVLTLYS